MTLYARSIERHRFRRGRRYAVLAFSAASLLPFAIGLADAADRLDEIKAHGELVVGVKTDYPPFGMLASNATDKGLEVDLAADLARRLGVALRTVSVSSSIGARSPR